MKHFDTNEAKKYSSEVKEKWGETDAYREHTEKTKNYSRNKWNSLAEKMMNIFAEFAHCKENGSSSDSAEAQLLVKALQNHITENYYNCTDEILSGLGQMYVLDERFKNNIDKSGDGTAEFVRDAIVVYCTSTK